MAACKSLFSQNKMLCMHILLFFRNIFIFD